MPRQVFNLPNLLTFTRILAVPVIVVALNPPVTPLSYHVAFFTCLLALLTDYLDGILARRKNLVTSMGKLLDPLADKLMVSAVFIMFVSLNKVHGWVAFLIVGRELIITGLRSLAASQGIIIKASFLGKNKMVSQSLAMLFLLAYFPSLKHILEPLGRTFLWISIFFGYLSAFLYITEFYRQLNRN